MYAVCSKMTAYVCNGYQKVKRQVLYIISFDGKIVWLLYCLGRFWAQQEVMYDWTAELAGTGRP